MTILLLLPSSLLPSPSPSLTTSTHDFSLPLVPLLSLHLLSQRLHSLRAYQQALELYQGKGWTLAEDYVQFCLAKHSFNLHRLLDAKEAFERLLSHESIQSPSLQRLHLQDYIYVHKVWCVTIKCTIVLPVHFLCLYT